MTTKYRIIIGFSIMTALLAVVAVIGYRALGSASDNFATYDRMARLNVLMSDAGAEMRATSMWVERFFADYKSSNIAEARKSLERATSHLTRSLELMRTEKNITATQNALDQLSQYKRLLDRFEAKIHECHNDYGSVFQPAVDSLIVEMQNINKSGTVRSNVAALSSLNNMWESFALARRNVASYMETLRADKAAEATSSLESMSPALQEMDAIMDSELARKDYARIMEAYGKMMTTLKQLVQSGREASAILEQTHDIDREIMGLITQTNAAVNKQMLDYANATYKNNSSAQTTMAAVSGGGLILGAILACAIILTLIRVLRNMARYASAVAMGDFGQDPKVHEKGEFGAMLNALSEIPAILNDVIDRCNEVSRQIGGGDFRTRLDESRRTGRFRDMVSAVNQVARSYTTVIDDLPVGVMTAGKDRKIRYLNKQLQAVFKGQDLKGDFCGDRFKTAACHNESTCFGACTMKANADITGEVQIHPDGKRMDLAVSASPLHDRHGEILGYMEVLNNITEIRTAEEIMRAVAHEAAEISGRVAASSEQLAAQVEQVTRGAETQRQRVESTASAMTQMNATVIEVARSAGEASEQSDSTRKNAESGARLVGQVVNSINNVNTVANRLQSNMNDLGKQAESIGEVLNVISDIADQTNLLALNAAIEAARAGEAGRGFAVVADEVRKLAEKTMEATQEVGQRIASMQNATSINISEVKTAVKSVTEATEIANSSGQALDEIVHLAAATSSVVASIATAAEEQSATSEEISRAITDINAVIAETTDGMVQSSHAVHDLSSLAQQLRSVMQRLA